MGCMARACWLLTGRSGWSGMPPAEVAAADWGTGGACGHLLWWWPWPCGARGVMGVRKQAAKGSGLKASVSGCRLWGAAAKWVMAPRAATHTQCCTKSQRPPSSLHVGSTPPPPPPHTHSAASPGTAPALRAAPLRQLAIPHSRCTGRSGGWRGRGSWGRPRTRRCSTTQSRPPWRRCAPGCAAGAAAGSQRQPRLQQPQEAPPARPLLLRPLPCQPPQQRPAARQPPRAPLLPGRSAARSCV